MNKKIYEFGEFLLDLDEKRLLQNGQRVSLQPKVFDMLAVFVEREGELITRDELMQAVWADTFVEETNLRFCIHSLRKVLGKNAVGGDYVETIPKRGYRFTAETSQKVTQIIPEAKISAETVPSKVVEKLPRFWLIGIAVAALIPILILAFVWQKNRTQSPKNGLGFETLAVLPFESVGENKGDLQIGLTDAMITNLSKLKDFRVLPLSSVRKFAGENFDALKIGKELGSDTVLSGSYRFDGENVRVTANLLRIANDETVWTETFTLQKKRGLELEKAIALRIARLLSLKIADLEDEQSLVNQKLNSEAAQNYLSARKIWRKGELLRRQEMIGLFEKAIALEPRWALAHTAFLEALTASDAGSADFEKTEMLAQKSFEIESTNPISPTAFGEIYQLRDWNWEKAESQYKKAIAFNPNYSLSHQRYSEFLRLQRRFAEAETEIKLAIEIEPFEPYYYASLCELYYVDRKYDDAIVACRIADQLEPSFWRADKLLFWIYIQKETYHEISDITFNKLVIEESAKANLKKVITKNDLRPYWQNFIEKLLARYANTPRPVSLALAYLQLGEKEKALDYLEQALAQRAINLPAVNANPAFDSIRNEKRFVEIMRQIGLQK